jgi:hypothetical protein
MLIVVCSSQLKLRFKEMKGLHGSENSYKFFFFNFLGLHPVASVIMTYLVVPSIAVMFPIVFILLFFLYTTTCFGPYMPSSGEIYTVTYGSYHAYNGSVFRLYNVYIFINMYNM